MQRGPLPSPSGTFLLPHSKMPSSRWEFLVWGPGKGTCALGLVIQQKELHCGWARMLVSCSLNLTLFLWKDRILKVLTVQSKHSGQCQGCPSPVPLPGGQRARLIMPPPTPTSWLCRWRESGRECPSGSLLCSLGPGAWEDYLPGVVIRDFCPKHPIWCLEDTQGPLPPSPQELQRSGLDPGSARRRWGKQGWGGWTGPEGAP